MYNNQAAQTYNAPTMRGGSPRDTEGRALLETARRMADAQQAPADTEALLAAVRINWRLWTIFQASIAEPDCPLPPEIRRNMIALSNFVDKRTVRILNEVDAKLLDVLISINRNIAAGLLTQPEAPEVAGGQQPEQAPPPLKAVAGGLSV